MLLLLAAPALAGKDLAKVYPGRLSWSQSGLFPVCAADDVWALKKFELAPSDRAFAEQWIAELSLADPDSPGRGASSPK